jgi:hypothetical protein
MSTSHAPTSSARGTAADWRSTVARVGLTGRALLYLVFGIFAIDVATGGRGAETTEGALEGFAGSTYGKLLLSALCAGLVALVAWKALQAAAGDPVEGSEATDRAEYAVKGVVYAAVLAAAVSVLIANWDSGSGQASGGGSSKQEATATVLEWPAGQFLVIAAGLGILGFGLSELWTDAWRGGFMRRIDASTLSDEAGHGVEIAGRSGYVAKGVTTVIIGGFLVVAGWQHDSSDTTGLSGAISELGGAGWGGALLWVVAIGMFAFAAFSLVEAALRRAS